MFGNLVLGVAIKKNFISSSSWFIKFSFVTWAGYTAGKFSYVNECNKKIKSRLPPDCNLYKIKILRNLYIVSNTIIQNPMLPQPLPQPLPPPLMQPLQQSKQSSVLPYEELKQRNRATKTIDYSNLSGYDELRMRNRSVPEITKKSGKEENDFFKITDKNNNSELNPSITKNSKSKNEKCGDIVYED